MAPTTNPETLQYAVYFRVWPGGPSELILSTGSGFSLQADNCGGQVQRDSQPLEYTFIASSGLQEPHLQISSGSFSQFRSQTNMAMVARSLGRVRLSG